MDRPAASEPAPPLLLEFPTAGNNFVNWTAVSARGEAFLACTFNLFAPSKQKYFAYCFARGATEPTWTDSIDAVEGYFWVAVSADATWAASGGLVSKSPEVGFVRACRIGQAGPTPVLDLDFRTPGRVNEVELSQDGRWLVACGGDCLYLFELGTAKTEPQAVFTGPGTVYGAGISADGAWIVAGMMASESGDATAGDSRRASSGAGGSVVGQVVLFQNQGGRLAQRGCWKAPWIDGKQNSFIQRIVIAPDGQHFAAASSNGAFYLFSLSQFLRTQAPLWGQSAPGQATIYGLALSADGQCLAAGSNPLQSSNEPPGPGFYSYVRNLPDPNSPTGFSPSLIWKAQALSSPNPGLSMDAGGAYVAAADGHPFDKPGTFYLLSGVDGSRLWHMTTKCECYPAAISQDASLVVCGSDDSNVYVFAGPRAEVATMPSAE